ARSATATSVNVPPMSTATARSADRIDIALAMEGLRCRPIGAERTRCRGIHRITADHHAILASCSLAGHEAIAHVQQHLFRRAIERMTVAATTAGLQQQDVAAPQNGAVGQWRQDALVWRAGI